MKFQIQSILIDLIPCQINWWKSPYSDWTPGAPFINMDWF